ncbi:MAG: class I SAM-dependent methyltransferase [Candidatus Azambacteria bacterium]|nr:class I SAM-dependent methyltransferase [Candidatus Azambacteria bacterium]
MDYQDKNFEYTNAEKYDNRGESSVVENYVLGLWRPFLKKTVADLSVDKTVVDLGCGTCEYATAAKYAKKIYAIDISEEMLGACRKKLENFEQAEIINSSIENFTLSVSADLVIAIGIWEYANPEKLYEKIKNITQSGSKVIVVFPNIYNDLNWMRSIAKLKIIAIRPGFIKKLFKNDFTLVDSASFGTVFWFPKKLQFLTRPIWKLEDWFWKPFQKFLPLGINVYYLFERQ